MNKYVSVLLIWTAMVFILSDLHAQETAAWPKQSSYLSPHMGFVGVVLPISLHYEHLWHLEKIHAGIAAGPVATFYFDASETYLGGYVSSILLLGMDEHHFEARLGASLHPITLSSPVTFWETDFPFIPVITIGYRHQLPGHPQYFRASFGSGGIGIGMGILLGKKEREKPESME